jgi:hypothetical protein
MNEIRDTPINIRVTKREKEALVAASKTHGMSITNFILTDPRIGEIGTDARIIPNAAMSDNPLLRPGLRLGTWPAESETK